MLRLARSCYSPHRPHLHGATLVSTVCSCAFVAINKVEPDVATKRVHHFAGACLSPSALTSPGERRIVVRSHQEKAF